MIYILALKAFHVNEVGFFFLNNNSNKFPLCLFVIITDFNFDLWTSGHITKFQQMIYQAIESEIFSNILLHRLSKQTTNNKYEMIFFCDFSTWRNEKVYSKNTHSHTHKIPCFSFFLFSSPNNFYKSNSWQKEFSFCLLLFFIYFFYTEEKHCLCGNLFNVIEKKKQKQKEKLRGKKVFGKNKYFRLLNANLQTGRRSCFFK